MNILYIVPAMYPYGWAYAARARSIARMMVDAGASVTVMADYLSDEMEWTGDNASQDGDIRIITTSGLKASERTTKDKLLVTRRAKAVLKNYLENNHVDYIVSAQTAGKYMAIRGIIAKKRIPLILEVCEWYSHHNWSYGVFDPRFWNFCYCWYFRFVHEKKFICISTLLERHFKQFGADVIRIPTILDIRNRKNKDAADLHSPVRLVFAGGITGGKDELSTLIAVVCEKDLPFEIEVFGPSDQAIRDTLKDYAIDEHRYLEKVHVHGYVPQQTIESYLANCDYGILIRPQRRSSNAGFPTKLGEYFGAGLPVIANDTGDICLYLKDGENGFVLESNHKDDIARTLFRIANVDKGQYQEMSKFARKTAEEVFQYDKYSADFAKLLK